MTAQSLEASDLPSSFELSSVHELFHPHINITDSKHSGYDGNNNNNNNNSGLSTFIRGRVDADISIDDVLDLTSHDVGFEVPATAQGTYLYYIHDHTFIFVILSDLHSIIFLVYAIAHFDQFQNLSLTPCYRLKCLPPPPRLWRGLWQCLHMIEVYWKIMNTCKI